ncbi:hypothetical protein M440DRAFT_1085400 [Trichoderma longibrachiatum ATCC 18648]|uniref:Uncharacterized protein n=1 Tax=Trichoderma longibrachiatum ATCC 18648 TaxID=983965 RepID=A0A2T4BU86_TRILO|nr:hypothetical protein M440DRAFT_1085400 [Trichoderma longibrachiatum ATCC 18648]
MSLPRAAVLFLRCLFRARKPLASFLFSLFLLIQVVADWMNEWILGQQGRLMRCRTNQTKRASRASEPCDSNSESNLEKEICSLYFCTCVLLGGLGCVYGTAL